MLAVCGLSTVCSVGSGLGKVKMGFHVLTHVDKYTDMRMCIGWHVGVVTVTGDKAFTQNTLTGGAMATF